MKQDLEKKISLPEGTQAHVKDGATFIKGPKGELSRSIPRNVAVKVEGTTIIITSPKATKKEKKNMFTYVAHLNNLVRGVNHGFVYKLKVCSGHFPMTAAVQGNKFQVKNFLGEKVPRVCGILDDVKVTISGQEITVESISKEAAGTTAARLESLTRICDKDRRIFQDGIYICEKPKRQVNAQ